MTCVAWQIQRRWHWLLTASGHCNRVGRILYKRRVSVAVWCCRWGNCHRACMPSTSAFRTALCRRLQHCYQRSTGKHSCAYRSPYCYSIQAAVKSVRVVARAAALCATHVSPCPYPGHGSLEACDRPTPKQAPARGVATQVVLQELGAPRGGAAEGGATRHKPAKRQCTAAQPEECRVVSCRALLKRYNTRIVSRT